MFYLFAGLVISGYLIYCGFMKVRRKTLVTVCPFAFVVPALAALVLFLKDYTLTASLVLAVGVIVSTLMLIAIRKLILQQKLIQKQNTLEQTH